VWLPLYGAAMTPKTERRMTKQGVRDLNSYGPKAKPPAASAEPAVAADDVAIVAPVSAVEARHEIAAVAG
jgi:hypothetical protein